MLEQALAYDPQSPDTRFELGKALYQSGQLVAAAEVLEQGLALSSQCRFHYLLIKVYEQLGRSSDVKPHFAASASCNDER